MIGRYPPTNCPDCGGRGWHPTLDPDRPQSVKDDPSPFADMGWDIEVYCECEAGKRRKEAEADA